MTREKLGQENRIDIFISYCKYHIFNGEIDVNSIKGLCKDSRFRKELEDLIKKYEKIFQEELKNL